MNTNASTKKVFRINFGKQCFSYVFKTCNQTHSKFNLELMTLKTTFRITSFLCAFQMMLQVSTPISLRT